MPGTDKLIETAAATGSFPLVLLSFVCGAFLLLFSLLVKWWINNATKQASLAAKIAQDSIDASAEREKEMVSSVKASESYIRNILMKALERSNEVAMSATNAIVASTESHKQTTLALRDLTRATEEQTRVIKSADRELTDSQIRKQSDHGGSVHG